MVASRLLHTRKRKFAGLHAAYLVAGGAWPLVDRQSLEALTGKNDFLLVHTVGGLCAAANRSLYLTDVGIQAVRLPAWLALWKGGAPVVERYLARHAADQLA
jgi:hypothetical protein